VCAVANQNAENALTLARVIEFALERLKLVGVMDTKDKSQLAG